MYICTQITTNKSNIMGTFKVIKFVYDKELNNDNARTYATKEAATNAGNSWERDCTVHAEIRKGRWFEVVEITE